MQQRNARRSNKDRSQSTRAALIEAGRALFTERAYGEIGTPEIVTRAGVTRGALYHHFADKQALFAAVAEAEAEAVAREIEAAAPKDAPAEHALLAGGRAYLDAMAVPGRTRLLLLDAPAILGHAQAQAIDARHAARTLREGLTQAMEAGAFVRLPVDPLTQLVSAAFDRAALAIEAGGNRSEWEKIITTVLVGLARRG